MSKPLRFLELRHTALNRFVGALSLAGGAIPTPRSALDSILHRERWHVRGTGWIGDAIYGINDGLGAVFGIVSGMAGYTGGSEVVLAAGLAGTLASALSMGAGAYLASKSQREVYESEVSREKGRFLGPDILVDVGPSPLAAHGSMRWRRCISAPGSTPTRMRRR